MEYGLIGEKLGHSFSPEIHKKIGSYSYQLCELKRDELDLFMREKDFLGINVTIPYKQAVIPYLDSISDEAERIGAVNTVVNKNGRLYGYNTDFEGLKNLILRVRSDKPLDGKVLVLGTGGTSLTAIAAAKALGADEVLRVSRSGKDGCITYDEALKNHSDAAFVINCTPSGMYPNDFEAPISLSSFTSLEGVADAVYNPLRTLLVRQAKKRNIPAEGGLYMLVSQAVAAYGHFFDTLPDKALTERIYRSLLTEKENIVLVGMPSSGKSSIGKRICQLLGRDFYDLDNMIVRECGTEITDIFKTYGESYFRDLESDAVKRVSSGISGAVIATGGGAVLREKNVDMLKGNGRIVFIDRDLEKLIPTSDRPLSSDIDKLKKRYDERYPIYKAVSDLTVPGNGSVDEVADDIIIRFKG